MAFEKSPAFQMYPKDFLADGNVIGMSLEERGAYITLLCICWQEGSLPTDTKRLAMMVGSTARAFLRVWPAVKACFSEVDGRLMQKRLEKERAKQEAFRRLGSVAGKASAAKRAGLRLQRNINGTSTDHATAVKRKSNSPISVSVSVSDLRSPKEQIHTSADADFEAFRQAYPSNRRVGGTAAKAAFRKAAIGRHGDHLATVLLALEQHKRSEQWQNPKLIPHMTTWLNQERWLQVLPEVGDGAGVTRTADVKTYAEIQNEDYLKHTT